jgi:hypothetical protein
MYKGGCPGNVPHSALSRRSWNVGDVGDVGEAGFIVVLAGLATPGAGNCCVVGLPGLVLALLCLRLLSGGFF